MKWLAQHWFKVGVLLLLLLVVVLVAYYFMIEVPREQAAQQAATQQQETSKQQQADLIQSEKAACASEAVNTAVSEYQSDDCFPGDTSPDCSNGTYQMPQYNNDYATCLQQDGIQ